MRSARPWAAGLALVLAAGCGDERLWARWQAERAMVAAQRQADRVLVRPATAPPEAWARAESAFVAVVRRWPPEAWHGRGGIGTDVERVSGRAWLAVARLRQWRGDAEGALAAWRDAQARWREQPEIALPATIREAEALDGLARFDAALAAWERVGNDFPLVDPATGAPRPEVLEAPLRVAREFDERGRPDEARRVLTAAWRRASLELRVARPPDALAIAAGRYAAGLGDFTGAMDALRRRIRPEVGESGRRRAFLDLSGSALAMARPDTALSYAREAIAAGARGRGRSHLAAARAFAALALADSALDQCALVLEQPRDPDGVAPEARWLRAELFAAAGQWEQARIEWSALQASAPTHELAFRSVLRIVHHHEARGEAGPARREAETAMNHVRHLLASNADPDVQRQGLGVLARLLADHGDRAAAITALADLWRRWPGDSSSQAAALDAARLARGTPGASAIADSLYRALAAGAQRVEIRVAAGREQGTEGRGPTP